MQAILGTARLERPHSCRPISGLHSFTYKCGSTRDFSVDLGSFFFFFFLMGDPGSGSSNFHCAARLTFASCFSLTPTVYCYSTVHCRLPCQVSPGLTPPHVCVQQVL